MGTTFSTINRSPSLSPPTPQASPGPKASNGAVVGCIVGAIVVVSYLYWYCKKIKKNPEASYTYEDREHFCQSSSACMTPTPPASSFDWRRKLILVLFVSAFIIMIYGVVNLHWWFPQMAASLPAHPDHLHLPHRLDEEDRRGRLHQRRFEPGGRVARHPAWRAAST